MKKILILLQLFVFQISCSSTIFGQIVSISPVSGNTGETVSVTIVMTNPSVLPLPPSNVQPTSVKIGSMSATSYNRTSTTNISASFNIPSGFSSGNYDVVVQFTVGGTTVNTYTLSAGFQVFGGTTVLYVNGTSGDDTRNGLSWVNAKKTIQSAINAADLLGGAEIWVKSGTYYPTTTTNRETSFALQQNVKLYGGFAGTETLLTQRDYTNNITTLSGDIGTLNDDSDNSYHVITTEKKSVIDGFTITKGNADGDRLYRMGGGIYMADDYATVENCIFFSDHATEGGAMYVFNINGDGSGTTDIVTINNCEFTENSASNGGAIVLRVGASSDITQCTFSENSAEWRGGAIYIDYGAYITAPITIENCSFSTNISLGNGGAIYSDDMASQLNGTYWSVTSCTFSNNTATYRGGAVANYNTANYPTFTSNTFSDNSAGLSGNAISLDGGVSLTANNNTLNSGQDINKDSSSSCSGNNCP
jgi:predicted outer membrane repeat protein